MKKKRVLVGMSGGVDSSVTAALLKKRGYDVIGITLQLMPKEDETISSCCNLGAINDAKRVASRLGIPHYTVNSRHPFKEKVMDYFVDQYLSGYTPNPCVECNRYIKFDELLSKAKDLDADFVATGHYVRRTYSPKRGVYYLKKGIDPAKDQSYFLYMLQSRQLEKILFPLGGYIKDDIRDIARNLVLINADKPDSQEICFVGTKSYKDYIRETVDADYLKPGTIVDTSGKVLGTHSGIFQYTIGQRKGLNLGTHDALYVLKIDAKLNQVIVGAKEGLKSTLISLKQFSLVNPDEDVVGKSFQIKMRYQMTMINATVLSVEEDEAVLQLDMPHSFVALGQSCVLYRGDRVIGGGVIRG